MKSYIQKIFILIFLFFLLKPNVFADELSKAEKKKNIAFEQLKEFHKRGGLPNFYQKIETSRKVNVAYLGGSITEAKEGWRTLTYNWLRVHYPETIFLETAAAIGGTGSNLGVFRVEHDVLQYKPDLLFVEFAVNDKSQKPDDVLRTMEGIIRKTWQANSTTDICFIYTMVDDQCKEFLRGELSSTILAMEKLADYYDIPSILAGKKVVQLREEGKLVFTADPSENDNIIVFTKDHTHPLSESGHPIYASVIVKYLEEMEAFGKVGSHKLTNPFLNDNWENAQCYSVVDARKTGDWELLKNGDELADKFEKFLPQIYEGKTGAKLSFKFKGTAVGLYDVIGPGSGKIKVTIDGKEREIQRFDAYCSYYRINNVILEKQLKDTVHTVEIEVIDDEFDKEKILSKRAPEAFMKNESEYKNYNYFLGNILIVGEGLR
ncbi:SGNH/GDSL hydrolase family protein [Maribellus maritimus]|uniref:SGNH/GDSL hydrolase family protein n=1 Tax=Maribellus maritimus TaxID=2870838 RepID=UPI001EECA704|nr:SGNH/GDSL hydrolase family protein [Maribellus maritimus]MCG6190045.1 SGNH/GDSL hydrolase family protein [Maribellus maritimus]